MKIKTIEIVNKDRFIINGRHFLRVRNKEGQTHMGITPNGIWNEFRCLDDGLIYRIYKKDVLEAYKKIAVTMFNSYEEDENV